jgi:putative ABC transport system permease protein
MFRNNLKIAWRNLLKDRQFTLLNVIGLATGLACTLLIFLWVNDEWGIDKFHQKDARLFQVMRTAKSGDQVSTSDGTGSAVGETIRQGLPEVEYAVTTAPADWFQKFNVSYKDNTVSGAGNFVGRDYFNVFTYPLLAGNEGTVLADPNAIVLSEGLAKKLFHTTNDIVGKTLKWKWLTFTRDCTVSGVFKDAPSNSSSRLDFVLPMDAWKTVMPNAPSPSAGAAVYSDGPFMTYLVLKEGVDPNRVRNKMAAFAAHAFQTTATNTTATLFLRKYSDGYLYGDYKNGMQAGGRIEYIKLFSLIALFILLIACINFMNLSTAKASRRIKEIGIKKALGAGRRTLIFQFLGESMVMSGVSMSIALLLAALLIPQFNRITGKELGIPFTVPFCLSVLGITLITGLLAGSYPATYLSRFNAIPTLKGQLKTSIAELWARKGLVIFQFTVSVSFIIAVLVVHDQVKLVETGNLGYDKEHVIYFETEGRVGENRETFLAGLKNIPGVVNASSIERSIILPLPSDRGDQQNGGGKQAKNDISNFGVMYANYGLIETLGIKMAEGRAFSRDFGSDSSGIILNEAAAGALGLTDPVGKTITVYGKNYHIVGVARNFHFNSFHETIKPFLFVLKPEWTMLIMARISPGLQKQTIQRIGDFYRNFNPGYAFDYKFLDDDYQAQYAAEIVVNQLSGYFAGLTVIISCLGLFGLAAFSAERRRKEISIRRVLGASARNVAILLSTDFLKLVLLAVLMAFPLAWVGMNKWLQGFAYRVHIGMGIFLAAGAAVVLLTFLAIGFQSLRAAFANPADSLKTE